MNKEVLDEIVRKLVDDGKLIEAGFIALKISGIPPDAPEIQVEEMRNAFFAGAQHLFASIMQMLEPGAEPTDKDLERLSLIDAELNEFIRKFKQEHKLPK